MKKLALVLGGGAAKGFAHIGVLKVLEKNNLKPDLIVGTSMGALIGSIYAFGNPVEELEKMALKFNSIGSFSLMSAIFKDSVINIKRVKKLLNKELGSRMIEDLPIKFVSVATELNTGKEVHFEHGDLYQAVMCSISMPAVFPRVKIGNNYYCDGGILNNLAEDVAREIMPDAVIVSVDVIGEYSRQVEKSKFKIYETIMNACTLVTTNVIKNRPQFADIRITICQPSVSQMDFKSETTLKSIKKGENITKKYIREIKSLLNGEKYDDNSKDTKVSKK